MKRKFFLLVIIFSCLLTPHLTWARPPSSIDLTYDPKTEILHIDLKHPSSNPQQHHIRKILVYKNNEEPIVFHYASQTSAQGTIQNVPLKAKPQDVIRVEAICSDAGRGEQTLIIPADVKWIHPVGNATMSNHLIHEKSPYLLQHVHNPVDGKRTQDSQALKMVAETLVTMG